MTVFRDLIAPLARRCRDGSVFVLVAEGLVAMVTLVCLAAPLLFSILILVLAASVTGPPTASTEPGVFALACVLCLAFFVASAVLARAVEIPVATIALGTLGGGATLWTAALVLAGPALVHPLAAFPLALAAQWGLHRVALPNRSRHLRQSECDGCGYDRSGLGRCPECGRR